jgi:hypothetical protein
MTIKKLTLLGPAARNKHGQACVRVQCSCGSPEFVVRADSYKQGRSTSCGFCRKGGRRRVAQTSAQSVEQTPAQKIVPQIASAFTLGTPPWFDAEISRLESAALASENRARFLELEIASQESTDLPTHKCWATEHATANKLRQAVSRLQIQKANSETATKKDTRTQAEINRDKIAALRGGQ